MAEGGATVTLAGTVIEDESTGRAVLAWSAESGDRLLGAGVVDPELVLDVLDQDEGLD